jgi:hypothetical protein
VIVTTEHLAKRYRKFNPNVFVCPNQIDPADWPTRGDTLRLGDNRQFDKDDGIFRVGWFASPSHKDDAQLVRRALTWAGDQKDVQVVFMGMIPRWAYDIKNVAVIPWSNDPGVYRQVIQWLDVGLAPVIETPWSVCRSDLKALEYGVSSAVPVLSDVEPYKGYHGPGFKARTPAEFLNHVRWLVQHRDEAAALGAEARDYVLKERTMEKNVHLWRDALSQPAVVKA